MGRLLNTFTVLIGIFTCQCVKIGQHGKPVKGVIAETEMMPSSEDFYRLYVRRRLPLLMRGAARDWPATQHWHDEKYLREQFGDTLLDVELRKTPLHQAEKPPLKSIMSISDFLNVYRDQQLYVDSPIPHTPMIRDILLPECVACDCLVKRTKSVHLLFSSGNTSSVFHYDGYDNFLAVLSGSKTLHLFNYSYAEQMYGDDSNYISNVSPIDPEDIDLTRFPKFLEIPFHTITINKGDVFYLPQHWWHHVRSDGDPNIAVSIWFQFFDWELTPDISRHSSKQEETYSKAVDRAPIFLNCKHHW